MPALRAHAEDLPVLVDHFIERLNTDLHLRVVDATTRVHGALQHYAWPGNVRELRNAVERAMLLAQTSHLDVNDFAAVLGPTKTPCDLPSEFEELERRLVMQPLERTGWNQTRATLLLRMNRDQIRYRVEKFGLAAPVVGPSTGH